MRRFIQSYFSLFDAATPQIPRPTCADVSICVCWCGRQSNRSKYQVVYTAIKAGYRLLDGAGDYGNEKEAGEGVRRAISEGIVKREDLCKFIR